MATCGAAEGKRPLAMNVCIYVPSLCTLGTNAVYIGRSGSTVPYDCLPRAYIHPREKYSYPLDHGELSSGSGARNTSDVARTQNRKTVRQVLSVLFLPLLTESHPTSYIHTYLLFLCLHHQQTALPPPPARPSDLPIFRWIIMQLQRKTKPGFWFFPTILL